MKSFTITTDILCLRAGDTVYPYLGSTYGCVADDEAFRSVPCQAVTRCPQGGTPFIVVASSELVENKS